MSKKVDNLLLRLKWAADGDVFLHQVKPLFLEAYRELKKTKKPGPNRRLR